MYKYTWCKRHQKVAINNDLPRHFRSGKIESKESISIKEHLFEDTQYNSETKDKIYFMHVGVLLLRKSAGKHAIVFGFLRFIRLSMINLCDPWKNYSFNFANIITHDYIINAGTYVKNKNPLRALSHREMYEVIKQNLTSMIDKQENIQITY